MYVICKKNPRHKQRQGYHTIAENHEYIQPQSLQQFYTQSLSTVQSQSITGRCLEFLNMFKLPFFLVCNKQKRIQI